MPRARSSRVIQPRDGRVEAPAFQAAAAASRARALGTGWRKRRMGPHRGRPAQPGAPDAGYRLRAARATPAETSCRNRAGNARSRTASSSGLRKSPPRDWRCTEPIRGRPATGRFGPRSPRMSSRPQPAEPPSHTGDRDRLRYGGWLAALAVGAGSPWFVGGKMGVRCFGPVATVVRRV